MEFEINIQHGQQGHVEITDYSKEYKQYYAEDVQVMPLTDKFKYSHTNTVNVITTVTSDATNLMDVLIDEHNTEKEVLKFDVRKDGYFVVTHFVLPNKSWVNYQLTSPTSNLESFESIYYVDNFKICKQAVLKENLGDKIICTLGPVQEVSVRELLERNITNTPIQKCVINIFYTGFLQECYINHCRDLFKSMMANCRPNCQSKKVDSFARDFLWMTLNVIDYLIEQGQFLEAQRILEEISYCGGFCNNVNTNEQSMCGCSQNVSRSACGCS